MNTFIILILIFFFGCSSDTGTNLNPEPLPTLMPLSIGNQWIYKVYGKGISINSDTLKWEIISENTIENQRYYLIQSSGQDDLKFYIQESDSGLIIANYQSESALKGKYYLKYPVPDGTSYNYYSHEFPHILPGSSDTLEFEVRTEFLQVEGGVYNVYSYTLKNLHSYFPFISFSPDIGMVRQTLTFLTNSGPDTSLTLTYDLLSYQVNK